MINLRKATCEDSQFVARMVMMALHMSPTPNSSPEGEGDFDYSDENMKDWELYHHMVELVEDEHTLYHWSRATIACDGDTPVGLCLAYDGADYHERKEYSFAFVCKDGKPVSENNADLLTQPDESGRGEMYVDSLAVIPEYRGKGIGRMMLMDALKRSVKLALMPTILVDPNNEPALRLYKSVGFEYGEEMRVFGTLYHKYFVR